MIDQSALDKFAAALTSAKAAHMAIHFPNLTPETYSAKAGKKYAKVTTDRSVFCFVDLATGDILKAAGYNAPAKGARGHISNGAADVTPYGPVYLNMDAFATYGELGIQ